MIFCFFFFLAVEVDNPLPANANVALENNEERQELVNGAVEANNLLPAWEVNINEDSYSSDAADGK